MSHASANTPRLMRRFRAISGGPPFGVTVGHAGDELPIAGLVLRQHALEIETLDEAAAPGLGTRGSLPRIESCVTDRVRELVDRTGPDNPARHAVVDDF